MAPLSKGNALPMSSNLQPVIASSIHLSGIGIFQFSLPKLLLVLVGASSACVVGHERM